MEYFTIEEAKSQASILEGKIISNNLLSFFRKFSTSLTSQYLLFTCKSNFNSMAGHEILELLKLIKDLPFYIESKDEKITFNVVFSLQ